MADRVDHHDMQSNSSRSRTSTTLVFKALSRQRRGRGLTDIAASHSWTAPKRRRMAKSCTKKDEMNIILMSFYLKVVQFRQKNRVLLLVFPRFEINEESVAIIDRLKHNDDPGAFFHDS